MKSSASLKFSAWECPGLSGKGRGPSCVSKTQGGEPGAPGRRLNTVARAAAPAMARQRAGHARERLVARAIWSPRAHPRMGRAGTDHRAALAVVRGCLWRRRHSLLHGGARAGTLGRCGAGRGLRAWRSAPSPADRAPTRRSFSLTSCQAQPASSGRAAATWSY